MISEIFSAASQGYVNIRQLEHNIEWFFLISAIGLTKAFWTYQSTDSYGNSRESIKRLNIYCAYGLIFLLVFSQFFPYVRAFMAPFIENTYDFIKDLWD